jgi:archaemetzincin
MANGGDKQAIFSFLRYDPLFAARSAPDQKNLKKPSSAVQEKHNRTLLGRCCKVLIHEIMHLFGIGHCTWFSCCMQGSGHLEEGFVFVCFFILLFFLFPLLIDNEHQQIDFTQPLHLCPIDLSKLQHALGFEVMAQYQELLEFYKQHSLKDEQAWIEKRITSIQKYKDSASTRMDEEDSLSTSKKAKILHIELDEELAAVHFRRSGRQRQKVERYDPSTT